MSSTKAATFLRGPGPSSSSSVEHELQRVPGRDVPLVDERADPVDRRRADAARRDVDDPLQREPVVGVGDGAQVADEVLDLGAVEEARAAHDDVRDVARAQRVLEHARLGVGPVEDGEVARRQLVAQRLLDARGDEVGLVALGLALEQHDALALARLGVEALGPPLGVLLDDGVGGAQDVAGRAVVVLELDHARARVVALEVEDVADVGAAPAVDRLVLVADDGDAVRPVRQQRTSLYCTLFVSWNSSTSTWSKRSAILCAAGVSPTHKRSVCSSSPPKSVAFAAAMRSSKSW